MSLSIRLHLLTLAAIIALPLVAGAQPTPEQWERLRRQQQQRGNGNGNGQQTPNVPRENLNASGVLKGARGAVLHLQTEEGEQWYVQVQPTRPQDVSFTGPAEASFVKPGMLVQFSTKLNKRGQADEPVKTLVVFSLKEGYQLGVLNESSIGGGGGASSGLFETPTEQPKEKKTKVKVDEDAVYRVAGQIAKISRTGEMTINAGSMTVKADLADDAKVSVDLSDLAYARAGDKVSVQGWYLAGQKGQAVGTQVSMSTVEPLVGPKKKIPGGVKPAEEKGDKSSDVADKTAAE
jgi:hypothetical protein